MDMIRAETLKVVPIGSLYRLFHSEQFQNALAKKAQRQLSLYQNVAKITGYITEK